MTMPRGLFSTLGTVSYNGYSFNNTLRTTSVEVRPEPDGSGRLTKYVVWTIALRWLISDPVNTDAEVRRVTELLTHPAGVLVFRGRGLGNPDINTGLVRDLKWGPKPGPVRLDLKGAGNATWATWTVSVALPCCSGGPFRGKVMELVYSVEHTTDNAGFTTRRVAGYLAIPITRNSTDDQDVPDSADAYRASVVPPKLKGFDRHFGPWLLSEDRTKLTFTITDEQRGGEVLPPNVVEAELSESVSSSQAGLMKWSATIAGSYKLRAGASGLDAARHFFAHVDRTLRAQKDELRRWNAPESIIPCGFSMTNPNRFGKPAANFQLQYMFTQQLRYLILSTGLWTQRSPDTWEAWSRSLDGTAHHPFGAARMRFRTGDEDLRGLCEPTISTMSSGSPPEFRYGPPEPAPVTQTVIQNLYQSAFKPPEPSVSWVAYENEVWIETDNGVFGACILPTRKLTKEDDVGGSQKDFAGNVIDVLKVGVGGAAGMPGLLGGLAGAGNVLQNIITTAGTLRRTKAVCYVFLRGYAVRAGFAIDPPRLLEVNGVEAIPDCRLDRGEGYGRGVRQNASVPLHYCRWNLRYRLTGMPPAPLPDPPNPLVGELPAST